MDVVTLFHRASLCKTKSECSLIRPWYRCHTLTGNITMVNYNLWHIAFLWFSLKIFHRSCRVHYGHVNYIKTLRCTFMLRLTTIWFLNTTENNIFWDVMHLGNPSVGRIFKPFQQPEAGDWNWQRGGKEMQRNQGNRLKSWTVLKGRGVSFKGVWGTRSLWCCYSVWTLGNSPACIPKQQDEDQSRPAHSSHAQHPDEA